MLERKTLKRIDWRLKSIKDRCNNPKKKDYKLYGARGIKCEFGYADFKEWILKELEHLGVDITSDKAVLEALDSYSVDRVDSNDNYSILNCTLTERRENEYLQLVEVNHICISDGLLIPLWLIDCALNKERQWSVKRAKKMEYASQFSFFGCWKRHRILNLVWYDFSKPPLLVKKGKVECPECGRKFEPQYILSCKCGFMTKEAKLIKKEQNREEVKKAEEAMYKVLSTKKIAVSQEEQQVRLSALLKHKGESYHNKKDMFMTLEEVGFVLGLTKEYVSQIEETAMYKLRNLGVNLQDYLE